MTHTDGSDTVDPDDACRESGRNRAEVLEWVTDRWSYRAVMTLTPVRSLAVVVILVGVLGMPLAAADVAHTQQPAATDGAVGSATEPGPGAHLAGIVAVQNSTVQATVEGERFRARIANATADSERAALVDQRLGEIERRLDGTRRQLQDLSRARDEGAVSGEAYTARAAGIADTAASLAGAANATERAATQLPADRRDSLQVADRVAEIRAEANRIRDETADVAAAIDGIGEQSRVAPVSRASVEEFFDHVAGAETPLNGVTSSERVNVHVRRANGNTPVFGVRIEDGRVSSVADGAVESPTLSVYTDYQVVDQVRRAEDPTAAIRTAIENDRIRYDGRGLVNSLKYGTLKLASLLVGGLLWLVPLVRP